MINIILKFSREHFADITLGDITAVSVAERHLAYQDAIRNLEMDDKVGILTELLDEIHWDDVDQAAVVSAVVGMTLAAYLVWPTLSSAFLWGEEPIYGLNEHPAYILTRPLVASGFTAFLKEQNQ